MIRRPRPFERARASAALVLAAITFSLALALAGPAPAIAEETTPTAPARPVRVFIDPGHGGRYSNANLPYLGIYEKNVNLAISLALRDELLARGYEVAMSRTTDTEVGTRDIATWSYSSATDLWSYAPDGATYYTDGVPRDDLQARCNLANRFGADIFISIHNNGAESTSAHGFENYSSGADILGTRLSRIVQDEVIAATPLGDRGSGTMDFYVVKWSHMPSVLVEGGFLTNSADRAYLTSWSGRVTLARAIAHAVDEFVATEPFQPVWPRIAGRDRFETAAAISQTGWPDGADTVLLATGTNWPDALACGPLSGKLDAPLLLAAPGSLPTATAEEIARLAPQHIIVLGGTGAIGSEVASAAAAAAGLDSSAVRRIAGADRYETSALIAAEVGVGESGVVAVAAGSTPADAVSIAPYAANRRIPILLTERSTLPTAVAGFRDASMPDWQSTLVIGGTAVVADSLLAELPSPERIAGYDRYWTNIALIERLYPGTVRFHVANGEAWSDSLAAGTLGGKLGRATLLVEPRTVSDRTRQFIENNEGRISAFTMIGGENALPYLHDWMLRKAML